MTRKLDTTKPFAIMAYDQNGEFGLVADQNGAITADVSPEAFVLQRKQQLEQKQGRSYEAAMSSLVFGMQFQFKAFMVEDQDHVQRLISEHDPDFKPQLKSLGSVAGRAYIITVPREAFVELLEDAADVGL